jgi:signal transduction histidine kinase/DNA-binding response OmpR family regulator/CHASE3 domain sensor protein
MGFVRNRLYLGFAIAIFLVIAVGILAYKTFNNHTVESRWVQHTHVVLNDIKSLQSQLFEMQASRRGFRTTGDSVYLRAYFEGLQSVQVQIDQLKELVSDNPAEVKAVAKLEYNVNELVSYWKSIQISPNTPLGIKKQITTKENALMSNVQLNVKEITDRENVLLAKRQKETDNSVTKATQSLIIGITLILLIVVLLIIVIWREARSRMAAQALLKDKLVEVEDANKVAMEKNWLLNGIGNVNDAISGKEKMGDLTQATLKSICEYLKVPAGAFYCYNSEFKTLNLQATTGIEAKAEETIGLNEGLVGSSATKNGITVIKDIPGNYWHIRSAGGKAQAGELVLLPLTLNDELKGLIELGKFGHFQKEEIALLNAVKESIATAVHVAVNRDRIDNLLEQVQEQRDEMEVQQEELRQTNEELTRQAEILQASEEELRVQEEELKQINSELKERNDAVEITRQALAKKAQELEQTSKFKSEFLANMSHELRTPLNSVLILAKILSENKAGNLTEKQIEYTKIIHKSGTDLLNLINDILDLSKIEAGKIDISFEQAAVADIKEDLEQLFRVVADEKHIRLDVGIDIDVPKHIVTDKQRLEQVLKNLLSNAFKFTPANGHIEVRFAAAGENYLNISVKDSGIGIAPEKQRLIFEAFQQADGSTSRKYGGTGLGLSISKELMAKLGGKITLSSKENEGSVFTLVVPIDASQGREIVDQPEEVKLETIDYKPQGQVIEQQVIEDDRNNISEHEKVMLIIEDDEGFATVVKDLAKSKGFKVIVAIAGDEGLHYAKKYKPSAIILDINLPVLDGRSILKIIKNDDELKQIPIHIISAENDKYLAQYAEGFTLKPLSANALENVFESLNKRVKHKKILIVVESAVSANLPAPAERNKKYDINYEAISYTDFEAYAVNEANYDCIVFDIEENLKQGIDTLKAAKAVISAIPLIAYLHTDVASADEMQLKRYADAVIRSSPHANERLIDELEVFLYKLKDLAAPVLPPSGKEELATNGAVLAGKNILVVDDDMRNVFALSNMLEEHGVQVITASDGREALNIISENDKLDMVLMDIMMPEMDGYTAMRQIRADKRKAKLPIIALTAKAMAEDRKKCMEAGASDYITKPIDSDKLLSLMKIWLSSK